MRTSRRIVLFALTAALPLAVVTPSGGGARRKSDGRRHRRG